MFKSIIKSSFFATIFIFVMIWLFSIIPTPQLDVLDPIGQTLSDFDVTDITYNYFKSYKHKDETNKFELNEEKTDTNVVIVNIGEQPRGVIGAMINIISQSKPKAIGIDAIFIGDRDSLNDAILSDAIKNNPNVVLASKFNYKPGTHELTITESNPKFSQYATNSFVNLVTDGTDDVAKYKTSREFYPKETFNGNTKHFFAIDLVGKAFPEKAKDFLNRDNTTEYINYIGNIGSLGDSTKSSIAKFTSIDFPDVLQQNFDPSLFKGKIVLLGFLGRTIGEEDIEDIFYSPLNEKYVGKTNPDMFGVVIHANIINMIINKSYINPVPNYVKIVLAIIFTYFTVVVLYLAFMAYPLMYGTLSKIIQLTLWLSVNFIMIGLFYKYNIKYESDLAVVAILLSGDMVEIYHEIVHPMIRKLYRLVFVRWIGTLKKS